MTHDSRLTTPVVAVSASSALGGSEWSLLDFARRAAANDLDLTVLLPKSGPFEEELRTAGVRTAIAAAPASFLEISQRKTPGMGDMLAFARGLGAWSASIKRAIRTIGDPPIRSSAHPLTLYSNGFKAHLACSLLGKARHVWHLREFPPAKTGVIWKALAGAVPQAAIANSNAVADAWALLGWKRPHVVHNGIDLERFRPAPRTGWIHQALDLESGARLIGMPAVLAKWKGQVSVVTAFERAADEMPGAHLVLVGGAIYDTAAERGFAEELVKRVRGARSLEGASLTSRIHFLKHQKEPWRLYPEFDLVVHFSTRPKPFGRVVAEALASGVPAIAARAGGPMEIVEDGVTGWLVKQGDVTGLSDTMKKALAEVSGPRGDELRQACRRRAEERFSAERYAAEVARVLKA